MRQAPRETGSKNSDDARASSIGPWLRAARMRRNTTQPELAKHLGTEQSELARIENSEIEPDADLRRRITAWIRSGGSAGNPKRGPYHKG